MEIMKERAGLDVVNWTRFSDNCAGQFKSRNTMGKLAQVEKNVMGEKGGATSKISWEFLEANEAKNESDTLGGFVKVGYCLCTVCS